MSSRKGRTRTDALLGGLLKEWAGQTAPPPAMRQELLRRARQPQPFRFGRLLWFWLNTSGPTPTRHRHNLLMTAGMNSLAHELLSLRLVA